MNNAHLTEELIKKEMRIEIKKFIETNETKDWAYQCIWDCMKVVLREKLMALFAYIYKLDRFQINKPIFHLKSLDKE